MDTSSVQETPVQQIVIERSNTFTLEIMLREPHLPGQVFDSTMFMRVSPAVQRTETDVWDDMDIGESWRAILITPSAALYVLGAPENERHRLTVEQYIKMFPERVNALLGWLEDVEAGTWHTICPS